MRKGNPKNIKTWDDLPKPGVEVITPNPFTSGGAKWNIMAAYGAQLEQGKSRGPGQGLPQEAVRPRAGAGQERPRGPADVHRRQGRRAALLRERGDHRTAARARTLDYVVPDQTILIQNPAAVTKDAAKAAKRSSTTCTPTPRRRSSLPTGYRSVNPSLVDKTKYPTPPNLFEITKFGGWSKVNDEFFDPEGGVVTDIFQSQGKSTASG